MASILPPNEIPRMNLSLPANLPEATDQISLAASQPTGPKIGRIDVVVTARHDPTPNDGPLSASPTTSPSLAPSGWTIGQMFLTWALGQIRVLP